jgi:tetratricopeptide (TPR) repeat protein
LWRPHGAGLNWAGLGQYRRALEQISEFMAAAGRPEALAADAGLMFSQGVSAMAHCRATLGEFAQGFATLEESLPVVNRYGTTFVQSQLLAARAMLELGQGAFQPAAEALEKSLALARKVNIPLLSFFVGGLLGEARLALGRWSDALPLLEAATSPEGLSLWPLNGRFLAGHAEALLAAGQPEAALKRARSALEGAAHREARAEQAALLRVLCEIALSGHAVPGGDAAHWITAALALARELDLRPLAAHCRMSLSRAHGAAGRQGPARRERQTALAEYEALGIRPGPGHPAQGVSSDKPRPALA